MTTTTDGLASTVDHSYSPMTVFEIRYTPLRDRESNQQNFERLMKTYGLSHVELRLLMRLPHVDAYGRPSNDPS